MCVLCVSGMCQHELFPSGFADQIRQTDYQFRCTCITLIKFVRRSIFAIKFVCIDLAGMLHLDFP